MAGKVRDDVVGVVKAWLLSSKEGVPIRDLESEYRRLEGKEIPYRELGYKSLEQFVYSLPDVSVTLGRGGEMILKAIPNENTEHLAALISKQKSSTKKYKATGKNVSSRRTAAPLRRLLPSSASKAGHSPIANSRLPLSVTVNNQSEGVKYHFAKPSRQVSFASAPTKPVTPSAQPLACSNTNTGGEHCQLAFEKPRRSPRSYQQGDIATNESAPEPVTRHMTSSSRVQDRLHQTIPAAEKTVKNSNSKRKSSGTEAVDSRATNGVHKPKSRGGRTITVTPLQARLNAAVRKSAQVQKTSLEERLAAASLGGGGGGAAENYVKLLEEYTASKGTLAPTYKFTQQRSNGKLYYFCIVKLDDFSSSSYPDERSSQGEAMQVAAKRALEEISVQSRGIGGSMTEDRNVIMSRVSHIVSRHPHGVWSTQIPIDYHKLHNETLPDDWLKIMAKCSLVNLEQVAGNRIIISPNSSSSASPVVEVPEFSMEASRGQSSVSPVEPVVPEPITLPRHDEWDMFITCCGSTAEIWGRLIGEEYSVKYENLATDMEMFYMGQVDIAADPKIGSFYAVKVDDCWHRVELVDMNDAHTKGRVFFIDHGDEEDVELNELHLLEQHFARLPAQAVRCFLWGLEHFADDQNALHHITDTIVGKVLIASVKSYPNPKNPGVGIILFDTSTEEDLDLNALLIESISKDAEAHQLHISKDAEVQQLPAEGEIQELYISHVSNTGDVFVQFKTYSYLQSLVSEATETSLKEDIMQGPNSYNPDPSRLYLARHQRDHNLCRAAITKRFGQTEVEVLFVDVGNTAVINTSELILLDTLNKSLAQFPRQAIKVNLHNVPCSSFDERMALRIRELVPFDECVLVKTISARSPSSIPEVEIFKCIQPQNHLVSINGTLAYEPYLKPQPKPAAEDGSSLRCKKRLEHLQSQGLAGSRVCPSDTVNSGNGAMAPQHLTPIGVSSYDDESTSKGLSPPQIPPINDYFDVIVTMAANPGNFTVQPFKDSEQLLEMMKDMQVQYNQQRYQHPSVDSVKEGRLYALLHHDGEWYRVCVSNVINDNMVSVYFCDYGDVSVVPLEKLQPLTEQFKELPYQAIKAKLAGIQPKHSDWSVEDCLMFQELVVEQEFVSIIMETGPDLLNPTSLILGLKLIDTSKDEDIYIDEVLVGQGRAVDTT